MSIMGAFTHIYYTGHNDIAEMKPVKHEHDFQKL